MKRHLFRILVLTFLPMMYSMHLHAQVSVNAQVFAEVLDALTATENAQMSFGKFSPGMHGGEILLSPDGVRTVNGNVVLSGEGYSPGSFTITGEDQAVFSIVLPARESVLTLSSGGSKEMVVTNWVSNPPAGTGTGGLNGGSQEVKVGATLKVGTINDNPRGLYTGSYLITFSYN
jgi:hypothetical protein